MEEENEENDSNAVLWIALIGAVIYGLSKNKQNNELKAVLAIKEQRIQYIENEYLKLLQAYMAKVNELPLGVKEQIDYLIQHYKGIDTDISEELIRILKMVENGQQSEAILKLTKVVENILKDKFVKENIYDSKHKCPSLFEMVKQAFSRNWITKREEKFIDLIRDPRNEEAHSLNVVFNPNEFFIYLLSGIEILHTFKGIRREYER